MYSKIISSGNYIPEVILDNAMLEKMVDTSDEWITQRVGIDERRINNKYDNWEMGVIATQRAMEKAGVAPEEIDMIVTCTVTPDYFTPSTACIIQGKIGAVNAFAFDMNAGCSAFVYALDLVDSYIKARKVKTAVICCTESLSRVTDYTDRSSCVLFGDAAGSVIVRAAEDTGLLSSFVSAQGSDAGRITARALYNSDIFMKEKNVNEFTDKCKEKTIVMEGNEVYKFAVRALPKALDIALERAGLTIDDIKYVISHQANKRILSSVIKRYGMDENKMPMNIQKYGNTSSACIPVLLSELMESGKIEKGDKIAFVGFGAGLTYGAEIVEM